MVVLLLYQSLVHYKQYPFKWCNEALISSVLWLTMNILSFLCIFQVKVQVTGQERETAKVCFKSGIISSCLREFQRNSLDERETMLKAIEDASSVSITLIVVNLKFLFYRLVSFDFF